ncbi:MAG: TraM recognition domain-containing protein [Bacteroidota bacterium]
MKHIWRLLAELLWPQPKKALKPADALMQLSPDDYWTLRDSQEGTIIFGATGSGKTSGSGKTIARKFLQRGMGGLVLTVKVDETKFWTDLAKECGREKDVVVFGVGKPHRFNFMQYEQERAEEGAGLTQNLSKLFLTVMEMENKKGGKSQDDFWANTLKQLLNNTIDLLLLADLPISVSSMADIISTAPSNIHEANSPEWARNSFCGEALIRAEANMKNPFDYEVTSKYWLIGYPNLAEKTRSIITTQFTALADSFMRGTLRELFGTETNIRPEDTWLSNKIIVLSLPTKTFFDIGLKAQVLFKYAFQLAVERRDVTLHGSPVFQWADEAQFFLTSYEPLFLSTARSSRVSTVYLTQNLPGMLNAAGGESARNEIEAMLGNLQTKIFHANGDPKTNEFAANTVGKTDRFRFNMNWNQQGQGGGSTSEQLDYQLRPIRFTELSKGGSEHPIVSAYLFQGGRVWSNKKNYLKVSFKQR